MTVEGEELDAASDFPKPVFEAVWEVVSRSGALVREGPGLNSPQKVWTDARGSTGKVSQYALLRQLELRGTRLCYELLTGSGPLTGWVSVSALGKALLRQLEPPAGPLTPGALPPLTTSEQQVPFAPRIIWTYWDQGFEALPAFHKLCIETWRTTHPEWRMELVDRRSIVELVGYEDLPPTFAKLTRQHRADCARLALLYRYGGVYMDPTILAWRNIPDVVGFDKVEQGLRDYVGYFRESSKLGMVENWFMACRRECEFVRRWHEMHLDYWWHRRSVDTAFNADQFFQGVDFSCFHANELDYLVQHACLAKLVQTVPGFKLLARSRAEFFDCAAAEFGGIWLNRKILHLAGERALRKLDRQQGVIRIGTAYRPPAAKLQLREPSREDLEASLFELMFLREEARLVDEVASRRVPCAKLTGPISEQLQELRHRDLCSCPSTLRRLLHLTLGDSVMLPPPLRSQHPLVRHDDALTGTSG